MVKVHDISLDSRAFSIVVIIDGPLVKGVQVDSGSSINLMNFETMEELDLIKLNNIPMILKMAHQSRIKPLELLP